MSSGTLKEKLSALFLMAAALGFGAIWSMHFVGMMAMEAFHPDGTRVAIRYHIVKTMLSAIYCFVCVFAGLWISCYDRFFISENSAEQLYTDVLQREWSLKTMKRSKNQMKCIAIFKDLQHLFVGGCITAVGVCLMHYEGMRAMEFKMKMELDTAIVVVSAVIAVTAACAAFWIIFRLLVWYRNETLRLASAFVMGVAVNGMHYTGMAAAKYTVDCSAELHKDETLSADDAFSVAILYTLCICVLSFYVVIRGFFATKQKLLTEVKQARRSSIGSAVGQSRVSSAGHAHKAPLHSATIAPEEEVVKGDKDGDTIRVVYGIEEKT
mmetsp:Transcript_22260/g.68626  ORF Transcript_22260/g.68626 Transcript_22260/m.68626 type:complete len:324 (+) Transcript_22260:376-1347(+)